MARMYSRKKGRSGSTRPKTKQVPAWVRYSAKEAEMLVIKLAKEKKTASQIGLILRDTYGIPDVKSLTGKSISALLKEKKMQPSLPEDLMALIKKNISIRKHLEENKQDQVGKRGLLLCDSKIKRLVKYYQSSGVLPAGWTYDSEKVRLLIE